MTETKKDPILASAKILMRIMQIFTVIGMFLLGLASICILIFQGAVMPELAESYPDISDNMPYLLSAFLLSVAVLLGLFWLQLNRLRAIVDSVDKGNPFIRINGERLRLIAVLIFVQQLLVLVIAPLVTVMQAAAGRHAGEGFNDFNNINFEISLTAILVALLLIILGRVLEQGADMQDELVGTV